MRRLMSVAALAVLLGVGNAALSAQEAGPKEKPGKGAGNEADCKRECQEQIRAIRENFHETVERLRRETEAQIAAIRATCKHGGVPGDDGGPHPKCGHNADELKKILKCKPGDDPKEIERQLAEHRKKCSHPGEAPPSGGSKGNNGVGNGIDPQPPGNPPVNDGPGTGPGNPGNKKHGASDGDGKPGKGGKPDDHGGPPSGKGKPGDDDGPGKGKGQQGPPPGKGSGNGPSGDEGKGKPKS